MQIDFYGANCIRIKTKSGAVVFDDNLAILGAKSISTQDDVAVSTNEALASAPAKSKLFLSLPGEYEIGDIMLTGIAAQAHIDEKGSMNSVIYKGIAGDIKFAVLGHIAADLSEEQLEHIGVVDVLLVPVGGGGYTLDAIAAAKVTKKISPRVAIPTHYEQKGIKYEVPQTDYKEFVSIMAVETDESSSQVLKLKKSSLPEVMEIKIL